MASDHRIEINGERINFTCKNYRFRTDIQTGEAHAPATALGSVFDEPLLRNSDGYSLWLEHVRDNSDTGRRCYWLMWYDRQGVPTVPLSSVLEKADIGTIAGKLTDFMP